MTEVFGVRNITASEIFGGLYILHDHLYGLINEDMHTSNLVCIINFGRNSTKSNFKIGHHIEVGLPKRERREKIGEKSRIFFGNFCPKSSKILNYLSEI